MIDVLFWFIVLAIVHELAHVAVAKYYNVYNGLCIEHYGMSIGTKIKYPVKVGVFFDIALAGFFATFPLAMILSIVYSSVAWLFLCVFFSLIDIIMVFLVWKTTQINPFFMYVEDDFFKFDVKVYL